MNFQTFTPFGYHYEGENCTIKLRFKAEKFMKSGLDKYRHFDYTRSGYIIFNITLKTNSPEFRDVTEKINSAR